MYFRVYSFVVIRYFYTLIAKRMATITPDRNPLLLKERDRQRKRDRGTEGERREERSHLSHPKDLMQQFLLAFLFT